MPDRLVVGEVRGREALPLVHALNASVDGAVVAMTGRGRERGAQPARDAARARSQLGGDGAIRELVASAFEIVVHVARHADGTIKVHSIEEVTGVSDDHVRDPGACSRTRTTASSPTGTVPRFYAELEARGIPADQAVFR